MLAAVEEGDAKKFVELMRQDPGFKVNMDQTGNEVTLLHYACQRDHRSAVIPLLLAHPDINVNVKNTFGETPFYFACCGYHSCVREMLKDFRVNVTEPDSKGRTPLWYAARFGHLDEIKWWIASGREMDLGTPGDVDKTDAIGAAKKVVGAWLSFAKKRRKTDVVTLLERFKENPLETRHTMRVELGWYDEAAAEMFALVVFVSDGILQVNDTTTTTPAARFFNVAAQLPLELQMVLCFRQVGSFKEIIPGKESEAAFKELARKLL